ncbi:VpaChn25_0724 family phage protein [Aggregatibacter actinomycetemcomitans]|uniref:VpaChn25_0724 family phage protein n=1 Tax=Aggregatibacter actinomycetemcomitans TaxID=714 RepID=UPI0011D817F7|nr:hypothetical protein [Aggregatibacter actinomycetemcomitans]TYB11835.1 hypothetical protein FXB84_04270 [Aggregatibacter actinomycetemcomitans]TYB19604.1 hypothetical protein FXB71_09480 [Aggregatibacter actinomycetemcomitans]
MYDIFTKDQRLVMLRTLAEDGYDANESILQDVLQAFGHSISRDLVRNHALWLEEQGLVKIKRIDTGKGEFFVLIITQRGLDVAQGRVIVDGVKRPSPYL